MINAAANCTSAPMITKSVGIRLDEYINKTAPLLTFYENKGLLRQIDGDQEIDAVSTQIASILRG